MGEARPPQPRMWSLSRDRTRRCQQHEPRSAHRLTPTEPSGAVVVSAYELASEICSIFGVP
jgi:hypothetical protein